MKTCPKCHLKCLNSAEFCGCGHSFSDPAAKKRKPFEDGNQSRKEGDREQERVVQFSCLGCGIGIRLRLRIQATVYRCVSCKCEYRTLLTRGETPVLLVVPISSQHPDGREHMSAQIKDALSLFGLGYESGFDDVRRAYRQQIKLYHPDLVSHLGPELKRIAEVKCRELNNAYNVLATYYSDESEKDDYRGP